MTLTKLIELQARSSDEVSASKDDLAFYDACFDFDFAALDEKVRQMEQDIGKLVIQRESLKEALITIRDMEGEINPSNYSHEDACYLNNQFIGAYQIAQKALEGME